MTPVSSVLLYPYSDYTNNAVLTLYLAGSDWEVVTHVDGWPNMGLRFQDGTDQREMLKKLMRAARDERYIGKFDVFVTNAYTGSYAFGGECSLKCVRTCCLNVL